MKQPRLSFGLCTFATPALISSALLAQDDKWPDGIPLESTELMQPLPTSPHGQPVSGYPDGPPAVSPDVFEFTPEMIATLNRESDTAGLVMPAA